MKKSRKLLCVLLALVMVVSLLPVMAFAADEDVATEETVPASAEEISPETAGIIGDALAKLPNYLVAVKTSDGRVAAGAQVVIYNQNKDQVATAVANYGVAIFSKKDHLNTYSVSATWTDPNTNIKYQSLVGFNWSFGQKPDIDVITVYPTIDMILNTTDHNAYIVGYPDGTVRPAGLITRAEVATILYRLMKDQVKARFDSKPTVKFSDVSSSDWYYGAVQMCAKAGIVSGYPDGSFKPNQAVTRAEFFKMVAMLYSDTLNTPITGKIFNDINGHWAEKYINLLQKLGIVKGDNGSARPNDNLKRGETAAVMNRILGRVVDNSSFSDAKVAAAMKTWPDCTSSHWAYAEIQEATNSHDYTWDINIITHSDHNGIFKAIIKNLQNPVTERWTSIKK